MKLAELSDLPDILRMARSFHEASPYKDLEFSEERCREMFARYLVGNKKELIIILAGDKPFGMIIGFANSLPFSLDLVATELAWWVDEEHRGSRESLLLFKAYEDWAKRIGARLTQMAMLDDVTNLKRFYEKQGYRPAEQSFIKET